MTLSWPKIYFASPFFSRGYMYPISRKRFFEILSNFNLLSTSHPISTFHPVTISIALALWVPNLHLHMTLNVLKDLGLEQCNKWVSPYMRTRVRFYFNYIDNINVCVNNRVEITHIPSYWMSNLIIGRGGLCSQIESLEN